jgi:hypothetical protein
MRERRTSPRLGSFLKDLNYTSRVAGSVEQWLEHNPRFQCVRRMQQEIFPATGRATSEWKSPAGTDFCAVNDGYRLSDF